LLLETGAAYPRPRPQKSEKTLAFQQSKIYSYKECLQSCIKVIMQTIIINSQKGGSGKTMLCAHLSAQAERDGDGPMYLIDTDPQGTLTKWHSLRQAEVPQRVEVPFSAIAQGLAKLKERGASYCIVDTAPTRDEDVLSLLKLANLVIVPVQPSPSDIWSVAATFQLLKAERIPFLFVLMRTKPNANITAQSVALLSKFGEVAPTFVADRTAYAASMTDGRTAQELHPKSPAGLEIAALWKNVKDSIPTTMTEQKELVANG
jgi:chromosome partitioning protein